MTTTPNTTNTPPGGDRLYRWDDARQAWILTEAPTTPAPRRRWPLAVIVGVVTFVLTAAVVAAGASTPQVHTVTRTVPGPTVTRTVPGPVRTVPGPTREVTPPACISALDNAVQFAHAMAAEHQAIGDAATAAAKDGDIMGFLDAENAAIRTATAKVKTLTDKVGPLAAECRAKAATQ